MGFINQQTSLGTIRSDAEGDGDRPETEGHGETGQAVPEMQQPNVEDLGSRDGVCSCLFLLTS